jgi:hypothetical protein
MRRAKSKPTFTYPLPVHLRFDPVAELYCRWCGKELNDRRKRYCCKEHGGEWFEENVDKRETKCYSRDNKTKGGTIPCHLCKNLP